MSQPEIPKLVRNILTLGEIVERTFDLKGYSIYATNNRLLTIKRQTIRDFDYSHISSIEYTSQRHWWLFAVGILLILGGTFIAVMSDELTAFYLSALGFIMIFIAAILKPAWVEVCVIGMASPVRWPGSGNELEPLLQIVREKRMNRLEAAPAVTAKPEPEKDKDVDSIDKIRRLAELRDDRIITQEEFEQKKRELLRNLHL